LETSLLASSILLWVLTLANLLLTLALIRRVNAGTRSSGEQRLKVGTAAPDFTASTLQGETITRATCAGRNVAFLFISPSCQPCRDMLPTFEALGPKAARSGVDLVLVSNAEHEATSALADQFHLRLPVLVAPLSTNPFARDYLSTTTPSYCLVNEQGKVQSAGYPSLEWGEWKTLVESWEKIQVPVSGERR
jgi:peroxiredoxin